MKKLRSTCVKCGRKRNRDLMVEYGHYGIMTRGRFRHGNRQWVCKDCPNFNGHKSSDTVIDTTKAAAIDLIKNKVAEGETVQEINESRCMASNTRYMAAVSGYKIKVLWLAGKGRTNDIYSLKKIYSEIQNPVN